MSIFFVKNSTIDDIKLAVKILVNEDAICNKPTKSGLPSYFLNKKKNKNAEY